MTVSEVSQFEAPDIFDIHVHLGNYEGEHSFPSFYLEELCSRFPIVRFIWAPFSFDESCRLLESQDSSPLAQRIEDRGRRWLWVSPVRRAGLAVLGEDVCPRGYAGIKLHPYADGYDLVAPLVLPVVEAAERWCVPVAVHTGNRGCFAGLVSKCFPRGFTCPLILFHSRPLDEAICVAKGRSNVYLELSFAPADALRRVFESIGPARVLFGSDYPAAALYYRGFDVVAHYRRHVAELVEVAERLGITRPFFSGNASALFSESAETRQA